MLLRYLDALVDHAYTTLIVTRSDLAYGCQHPLIRPSRGEIWSQLGEDFNDPSPDAVPGVSDRHAVFHFDDRHKVLGVLRWLSKRRQNAGNIAGPEALLGKYYRAQNFTVRRYTRVNFAVRETAGRRRGYIDETRWSVAESGSSACGAHYRAKYWGERHLAVATCRFDPCTGLQGLPSINREYGHEAPPKMLKNRETHVAEPAQVFRYQHSPRWHAEELQLPDGRAPAETLRWGVREH